LKNSKLLFLVNVGEPLPLGGNREHRMCAWKRQLEAVGFQVKFFTTDFEHQRKQWVYEAPEGYILLKSYISYKANIDFRRVLNHLLLSISLFRAFLCQNTKPDVIIVSYPTVLLAFASLIYGKLHGVKVVVDVRDKWPDIFLIHPLFILLIWPLYVIKKIVFRYADYVTSISPNYLKWAMPNRSIDFDYVLPLAQPNVKIIERSISSSSPIKLIFAGTLGSTYDLNAIFLIHDILIKNDFSFIIDVCGDGPKKTWFEDQMKSRSFIQFHGWLSKSELQDKMDNAHFGLMLYNNNAPQGWPNKLIEYMANGLPIINTLTGESWELIEQEGLGVNCNSSEFITLINWIFELLNNESKYIGYVQRNYELHKNRFNDESIFNQLKNIL
jgi:glycosyltransferase involved in cell wall biosynthesis